MKAVILAGGKGQRMGSYTTIIPKPLMPLGDRPILDVVLRRLKIFGFSDVTMCVGHLADLIIAYFGEGSKYGVKIEYSERETVPLGTAGPLSMISGLDDTFLVMNGDLLTTIDFADLIAFHRHNRAAATIAVCNREAPVDYGVIEIDKDENISAYIEKPAFHFLVSMGIYVFEPKILASIPKGARFDIPELIKALLIKRENVKAYKFSGYWQDIGRIDDYKKAAEDFEKDPDAFLGGKAASV